MKVKTSIFLTPELLIEADRMAAAYKNRSAFIETVLRSYLAQAAQCPTDREPEHIRGNAAQQDSEARDVLEYQRASQAAEVIPADREAEFIPRTALGNKLLSLRTKAISAGMNLLSEEEVLEEVQRRRGELDDNETDIY